MSEIDRYRARLLDGELVELMRPGDCADLLTRLVRVIGSHPLHGETHEDCNQRQLVECRRMVDGWVDHYAGEDENHE